MKGLKRVWHAYFAVGLVVGLIKLMSVVSWYVAHISALAQVNAVETSYTGTFAMGLLGALFSVVAWPLAAYQWLSGDASASEILLFPWVLPT